VPFRQAHKIVGALIKYLIEKEITTSEITEVTLQNFRNNNPILDEISIEADEIRNALDPSTFITRHNIQGGPAPDETKRMLQNRNISLTQSKQRVKDTNYALSKALNSLNKAITLLLNSEATLGP
jgi:argininosuccinate lyase